MASKAIRNDRRTATRRTFDPALAIAVVLTGCLLSFYLIGLPLIAVGAWMWVRRRRSS